MHNWLWYYVFVYNVLENLHTEQIEKHAMKKLPDYYYEPLLLQEKRVCKKASIS